MNSTRVRNLLFTWLALLALLALTLGSAFVPMGWGNAIVNLAVASAKALLVLLVFMHLAEGKRVLRLIATAGFFWLALLFALGLGDFLTRQT